MSEIAIEARDLVKVYRLYNKPSDKFLDAFGLLRKSAQFSEHRALDGVTFTIRKGEKVGIIGRNGAGKSTLLKLVTGTIAPTSGTLTVHGETQALLQIGTGFHLDLTGRENVVSYLAQLGISGARATDLVEDIVAFSEVEEYIDQPVKSYSTGMAARLMFAASTVIEPNLLVIDEVLGVGDAYFAQKSYERIRELCETNDATLLLVSHDIYSCAQISERIIWIDRGRIRFDGDPKKAINLYEASIKEQEERRLRRKALLAAGARRGEAGRTHAVLEIRASEGGAFDANLFFGAISLQTAAGSEIRLDPVTGRAEIEGHEIALVHEGSNWLSIEEAARDDGVMLANHGTSFHKGTLRVSWPASIAAPDVFLDAEATEGQAVQLVVLDGSDRAHRGVSVTLPRNQAVRLAQSLDISALTLLDDDATAALDGRHGSGTVRITGVDVLDDDGTSVRMIETHQPLTVVVDYAARKADVGEIEVMLVFKRDRLLHVLHVFQTGLGIPANQPRGRVTARIDSFPLARGRYSLTVMVARSGYFAAKAPTFFSINPDVFDVQSDAAEILVQTDDPAMNTSVCAGKARWSVKSHMVANGVVEDGTR